MPLMDCRLVYESDRFFSFFGYSMSHGLLLLGRGKSKANPNSRVDVLFQDVRAAETRACLKGITIKRKSILTSSAVSEANLPRCSNREPGLTLCQVQAGEDSLLPGLFSLWKTTASFSVQAVLVSERPVNRWALG